MWKFIKPNLNGQSPIAEVMSRCSSIDAIRLAVYNLAENRVDCAASNPTGLSLSRDTLNDIRQVMRDAKYAILAYDMDNEMVYLIDFVPELNAASAVLLCVVTELMGGHTKSMGHQGRGRRTMTEEEIFNEDFYGNDDDNDDDWDDDDYGYNPSPRKAPEVVRRDARGRFVPKAKQSEITPRVSRIPSGHRFHIGSRRR